MNKENLLSFIFITIYLFLIFYPQIETKKNKIMPQNNVISQNPCAQFQHAQTQTDLNIFSHECYIQKHLEYNNFINNLDYSKTSYNTKQKIQARIKTYDMRKENLIEKEFPHRNEPMYYGSSFSMQYSLLLINFDDEEIKQIKNLLSAE